MTAKKSPCPCVDRIGELKNENADLAYVLTALADAFHEAVGCAQPDNPCLACDAKDSLLSWE